MNSPGGVPSVAVKWVYQYVMYVYAPVNLGQYHTRTIQQEFRP